MLEQFKHIKNVGRYAHHTGTPSTEFKRVTLVYSENGRGKTTLCAILRSLTSGLPDPILERRRIPGSGKATAVVKSDGRECAFDGSKWNQAGPKVLVFDDHFTDTHVYSGLEVSPGHRQKLHGLVIGEDGVTLAHAVDSIAAKISSLREEQGKTERLLTPAILGDYSIKDFCALPELDGIEQKITSASEGVKVLQEAQKVEQTPGFGPLGLPVLPTEAHSVLEDSLPKVESSALEAVSAHLAALGSGSEDWTSKGLDFLGKENACPFCRQHSADASIIGHYRSYFSDAYKAHKQRIGDARSALNHALGGDALARFHRTLQAAKERHSFWSRYLKLPEFQIDTEDLERTWKAARDTLAVALDEKAKAPLDSRALSGQEQDVVDAYHALSERVSETASKLLALNNRVELAREKAKHGNLAEEKAHLALLEATKRRFSGDVASLCNDYLNASKALSDAEKEKKTVRESLNEHRAKAFRRYEASVNTFLRKFNADFRLEDFSSFDGKGGASSQYQIGVNEGRVPLGLKKDAAPEPSFRTALSCGDRTTLALAMFFVQLEERSDLSNATVVFDDPVSSLDDHRTRSTVEEIVDLIGRTEQVVVFSHSAGLLCQLRDQSGGGVSALTICNAAANESTIEVWDIDSAAIDEYDRNHELVRGFAKTGRGETDRVAPALRMVLERFVRIAFNEHCPPGTLLGQFLDRAKNAAANGDRVMSDERWRELDKLRNYANRFHHSGSEQWQENITNVNSQELQRYATRVIEFTQFAGGVAPPSL